MKKTSEKNIRSKKAIRVKLFYDNQHGFTLIEMMIAMAISLLVMSGVYEVFTSQQKAFGIQDQVAEMQQNARVAMDMMTRSIRMAGFEEADPSAFNFGFTDSGFGGSATAISVASNQEIYFTKDSLSGGTAEVLDNDWEERVGFRLWDTENNAAPAAATPCNTCDLQIIDSGGNWQPLAENITDITFTYTYADGDVSTAVGLPDNTDGDSTNDLDNIRIVKISLTARTSRVDSGFTHLINGDGYRTRTLTANVRPRNMGL